MKIAIVGAGAIGGLLAVKLARSGQEVTVIDRGNHLAAIKAHGLKLIAPDGSHDTVDALRAVATCAEAGPQDVVFLAVKANVIESVAPQMRALFDDDTIVVPIQNGLPWWYFLDFDGPHAGYRMKKQDPAGIIEQNIETRRVIGCVVYPAGDIAAPGVIHHLEGDRFPIGEPDATRNGVASERATRVSNMLQQAGFKAPILDDIRSEIWLKLWGNMSFNPISALTHATLVDICQEPATRALAAAMMTEAQIIGEKLGATFRVPLEKRIAGAEKVGKHKTSTLQDVEAGRRIEIDALIGSVIELGELTQTPTPSTSAVYALMKLLDKTMADENAKVVLLAA